MEIWLEPVGDGVVLHWYLRADPLTRDHAGRPRRERARVRRWKEQVHALKDELEGAGNGQWTCGSQERGEPAESQ